MIGLVVDGSASVEVSYGIMLGVSDGAWEVTMTMMLLVMIERVMVMFVLS